MKREKKGRIGKAVPIAKRRHKSSWRARLKVFIYACDNASLPRIPHGAQGAKLVPSRRISGAREKIINYMESTMKLKILSLSALVIFALALCMSVTTTSASPKTPAAAAVPAATPQPAAAPAALPEPHPEIREAIGALRNAKAHLEHAAHDFGGHRVEAIKAIDESLHQLQDCLKYDRD
jgi:hypothetical protein